MIDEVLMREILAGEFSEEEKTEIAVNVGDTIVHNKRGSSYEIKCIAQGGSKFAFEDGENIDILTVGPLSFTDVTVQVSTTNHSCEWFVYENFHGRTFLRPCSEFTARRFTLLG